ncbi:MAG: hypothetical protein U0871_26200 [Gemmataceae bacterium]
MSDTNDLASRIDGVVSDAKAKLKAAQQELLQEYLDRQSRLERYAAVLPMLQQVVRPRLELLAKKFGDRVEVTPHVSGNTRSAQFAFKSPLAHIDMTVSASPDREAKNVVIEYGLQVIPVLMRYESHAEFVTPIDGPDTAGLGKWLDDRLVGFVETFMKMHESEHYTKEQYVEDPVMGVRFPKFAAGATLEHGGKTYYFVDERTKQDFVKQKGV